MANKKITQKEFLERVKQVHGDNYDYSETVYSGINNKIKIICPKHGEFWQTPNNHLRGTTCPLCSKKKKTKTLDEFIEESKQVHGDKYDYSKVKYVNVDTKVCIICPEHGEFWQTPYNHLLGKGCNKCKGGVKYTTGYFIEKSKQIHSDKYDYSKVEYVNITNKVCIICPIHGEFWQTPNNHLRGCGCRKCHIENSIPHNKSNVEEFIEKARKVHGDKYDYSKVKYYGKEEKVEIICPIHNSFMITPHNHLRGQGCRLCGIDRRTSKIKNTLEDFIERAKKVHGDKYDYSKVEYINADTKVCIICSKHGEFWQTPNSHLSNHGCPICKCSLLESSVRDLLIEKGEEFIEQQKFDWLKNKGKMSLDFYLPKHQVAIECQGEQHFFEIDFFKSNLNDIIYRDEKKYKQCIENNIDILYYTTETIPIEFKEKHTYYTDLDDLYKAIIKKR